jgi:hypothetical protein
MNSANSLRDLTTMVHEGGHAIHTFLTANLELNDFKHCPSEVAELASMSMELISMDNWDIYFDNEEDLIRAKKEQLVDVLKTMPWVAVIDQFQHWIYTNPIIMRPIEKSFQTNLHPFRCRICQLGRPGSMNLETFGKNNFTFLKFPFIILNMQSPNWEPLLFGKITRRIHKRH